MTFSSHKSYVKAVSAAFVEIKTAKFTKKVNTNDSQYLCSFRTMYFNLNMTLNNSLRLFALIYLFYILLRHCTFYACVEAKYIVGINVPNFFSRQRKSLFLVKSVFTQNSEQ